MTRLAQAGRDLARAADRLATAMERRTLPESAVELDNEDLSILEQLAVALFAEGRPGSGAEEREEKVALASVIAGRAGAGGRASAWDRAIRLTCPAYGGPRWRAGAALLFERPALLTAPERHQVTAGGAGLRRELAQAREVAGAALRGELPRNTPDANAVVSEVEIAAAKAAGLVTPASLVRYGDHWFYRTRGSRAARGTRGSRAARGASKPAARAPRAKPKRAKR